MQELKSYVNRRNQMGWTALLLAAQNGFDSSLGNTCPCRPAKGFWRCYAPFSGHSKSKACFSFQISGFEGFSACFENICWHPESNREIWSVIATLGLGYANSWWLLKLIPTCPLEVASWRHWCWQLPMAMKKPLDFSWNLEFFIGEACFGINLIIHPRYRIIEENILLKTAYVLDMIRAELNAWTQ